MGYYLPRLPSALWLTIGIVVISLLYLYTPQGLATVNMIALNMPAPFGPVNGIASGQGLIIADLFLGIILGVGLKLVDAPMAKFGAGKMHLRKGEAATLRSIHRMELREGTRLLTKRGRIAIRLGATRGRRR